MLFSQLCALMLPGSVPVPHPLHLPTERRSSSNVQTIILTCKFSAHSSPCRAGVVVAALVAVAVVHYFVHTCSTAYKPVASTLNKLKTAGSVYDNWQSGRIGRPLTPHHRACMIYQIIST